MFWYKKKDTKKHNGYILWQGDSLFDGNKIAVIATGFLNKSENRKTGQIIQTYIIRRDIHPILARRLGEDRAICNSCKMRESNCCYTNLCHGPVAVFKALIEGNYKECEEEDLKEFKGKFIRIGTYGDPAAVPYFVWEKICSYVKGWTGYTHSWKTCDQRLKRFCMASVDSIKGYMKEYEQARILGWRTFRIRENLDNELTEDEVMCPASEEAGKLTTCEKCLMCGGLSSKVKKDISIVLHGDNDKMGVRWKYDRYVRMMKKVKNKKKYRRDYKAERRRFQEVCSY